MPTHTDKWCDFEESGDEDECIYIDLNENKEVYTAYDGRDVWQAIYQKNCILDKMEKDGITPKKLLENKVIHADIAPEETLLFQIISGLHASVNMHIAANYYDADKDIIFANRKRYFERFGSYPERIKNLYFNYAMVVRSINKIHD